MKPILMLFTALGIPLAILNMLGGVVSGIWLALLGEWGSIGYGVLAMVFSGFVLGIALMPSLLLQRRRHTSLRRESRFCSISSLFSAVSTWQL